MKKQIVYYVIIALGVLSVGWCWHSQIPPKEIVKNDFLVVNTKPKNIVATTTLQKITNTILQKEISLENASTCRNEEYGYEFKYPHGWNIYEIIPNEEESAMKKRFVCVGEQIVISEKETDKSKGGFYPPAIIINIVEWNDSLQKYIKNLNSKESRGNEFKITEEKTVSVNAKIAWYTKEQGNSSGVFFFYKNRILSLSVDDNTQRMDSGFLEKVVSTLKLF